MHTINKFQLFYDLQYQYNKYIFKTRTHSFTILKYVATVTFISMDERH